MPRKTDTGGCFESAGWENADTYHADLILLGSRSTALQPKDLASRPAEYPNHLAAIVDILANLRSGDPGMVAFLDTAEANLAVQVEQIRKAQRAGEFCDFDPWVMMRAIRAAIDDVVRRATHDPGLDVRAAGRELADLFDRATRRTS